MKENPPRVGSRKLLKEWAYEFHNDVNMRTGKRILTFEEADEILQKKYMQASDVVSIIRSNDMHIEDNKIIEKWKDIANKKNKNANRYMMINVTINVLLLIVIVILLNLIYKCKKRRE